MDSLSKLPARRKAGARCPAMKKDEMMKDMSKDGMKKDEMKK